MGCVRSVDSKSQQQHGKYIWLLTITKASSKETWAMGNSFLRSSGFLLSTFTASSTQLCVCYWATPLHPNALFMWSVMQGAAGATILLRSKLCLCIHMSTNLLTIQSILGKGFLFSFQDLVYVTKAKYLGTLEVCELAPRGQRSALRLEKSHR